MQPNRTLFQRVNGLLGLLAIGSSFGLLALELPSGPTRNLAIIVNLVLWATFCITYPIATVQSGTLFSRVGSYSCRQIEPARFWVGLVTYCVVFALVFMSIAFVSFHAWAR